MRHTKLLAPVLVGVLLATVMQATAGEADAVPKAALKGFKGFLVGDLVKVNDDGVVVFVRAVTLVKGNAAANAAVLMGKEAPVRYATEKDDAGQERPVPELVKAVKHIGKMPAIAFGGLNAPAMVVMGQGAGRVNVTRHRVAMRVNGMDIRFDNDDAEPEEKPQGPLFTARVLGRDDGILVMDRLMPGSSPTHTWAGMPVVRFEEVADEVVHVHATAAGRARAAAAEHAQAAEFDRAHAAAVAGRAIRAQGQEIEAQRQATIAQIRASTQQVVHLKKLLEQADQLPPETVRIIHEQMAHLQAQTAALKHQMAVLGKKAADLKHRGHGVRHRPDEAPKPEPPPKEPGQTDF
ncbi:hypothetical protein HQ560_19060 [bacterium]|nr:hypothetical protein [bacterium]